MIDAVFIDLDGTLTDPKPGITACIRHALDRLGLPAPHPDELTWCIGPPMQESLRTLAGSDERGVLALEYYRDRYSSLGLFENSVYPGIPEALAALRAGGPRLYVATSKARVYAERIIDHFGLAGHFIRVFGSELDGTNVHKADLLRYALAETGENPARALMVGDRLHDAYGAHANGLTPVGVLWGYGSREELLEAGVTRLIERPQELGGLVQARA